MGIPWGAWVPRHCRLYCHVLAVTTDSLCFLLDHTESSHNLSQNTSTSTHSPTRMHTHMVHLKLMVKCVGFSKLQSPLQPELLYPWIIWFSASNFKDDASLHTLFRKSANLRVIGSFSFHFHLVTNALKALICWISWNTFIVIKSIIKADEHFMKRSINKGQKNKRNKTKIENYSEIKLAVLLLDCI